MISECADPGREMLMAPGINLATVPPGLNATFVAECSR
jgi:hypothetical protein